MLGEGGLGWVGVFVDPVSVLSDSFFLVASDSLYSIASDSLSPPLVCQFLLSLRLLIFPCFRSRWGRLRESGLVVLSLLFVILSQEVWLMLLLGLLSVLCCCLPVCIQELNPEEVSQTRSVPRVGACREEGVWEICTKHCR